MLYRFVNPVMPTVPLPMPHVITVVPGKWVKVDVPIVHNWPSACRGWSDFVGRGVSS